MHHLIWSVVGRLPKGDGFVYCYHFRHCCCEAKSYMHEWYAHSLIGWYISYHTGMGTHRDFNPFMPVAAKTTWLFWWYRSNKSNYQYIFGMILTVKLCGVILIRIFLFKLSSGFILLLGNNFEIEIDLTKYLERLRSNWLFSFKK